MASRMGITVAFKHIAAGDVPEKSSAKNFIHGKKQNNDGANPFERTIRAACMAPIHYGGLGGGNLFVCVKNFACTCRGRRLRRPIRLPIRPILAAC